MTFEVEIASMVCEELNVLPSDQIMHTITEAIVYGSCRPEYEWGLRYSPKVEDIKTYMKFIEKVISYCSNKLTNNVQNSVVLGRMR